MAAKGILGRKLGMTQVFDGDGRAVGVTVIEAGPCIVVARRQPEKDGYAAVQLGYEAVPERKLTKPERGHLQAHGIRQTLRHLREFRFDAGEREGLAALEPGATVTVEQFAPGERVDVSALTRGKGFAGVIKRGGSRRGPMSHGSMYHRRVGTLGATGPQRVLKGKKMPGRLGRERVTIQALRVIGIDPERNLLLVHGAVPGAPGTLVEVRSSKLYSRRRYRREAKGR
ncbi:MAG: 50S ribosomal protein L3 [Firmicutes bacterium]|nr:50S ribosomal protein L3 [Bacillota bacterium]